MGTTAEREGSSEQTEYVEMEAVGVQSALVYKRAPTILCKPVSPPIWVSPTLLPTQVSATPRSRPWLPSFSGHAPAMSIAYEPLRPQPTDNVLTPTAVEQDDVEQDIVELVDAYQHRARHVSASKRVRRAPSSTGGPDTRHLLRADVLADTDVPVSALAHDVHRSFLERIFSKPFPGTFLAFDSSRCWLIYWTAQANALMGIQMDEHTKTRAISTLLHSQNGVAKRSAQSSVGGFGSGHGQISHLMGTYAAVMALAILGGPGPAPSDDDVAMGVSVSIGKGGWDAIDR